MTSSPPPAEIDLQRNTAWRRWKSTAIEWLAVIISCASAMVSTISIILVAICVGIIWSLENRVDKLEAEVETYSNRVIRYETWMKSKGMPLEEILNEP